MGLGCFVGPGEPGPIGSCLRNHENNPCCSGPGFAVDSRASVVLMVEVGGVCAPGCGTDAIPRGTEELGIAIAPWGAAGAVIAICGVVAVVLTVGVGIGTECCANRGVVANRVKPNRPRERIAHLRKIDPIILDAQAVVKSCPGILRTETYCRFSKIPAAPMPPPTHMVTMP
jgi:hypothetical protein